MRVQFKTVEELLNDPNVVSNGKSLYHKDERQVFSADGTSPYLGKVHTAELVATGAYAGWYLVENIVFINPVYISHEIL